MTGRAGGVPRSRPHPGRFLRLALGIASLALVAACGAPRRAPDASAGLARAAGRYAAAAHAADAEAMGRLYASDALLLPPDEPPIEGREAILEFWREGMEPGVEMEPIRIDGDGSTGYVVGRYRVPATDDEPADSGKYVLTLEARRGAWVITSDIWNTSSPAEDAGEGNERVPRVLETAW